MKNNYFLSCTNPKHIIKVKDVQTTAHLSNNLTNKQTKSVGRLTIDTFHNSLLEFLLLNRAANYISQKMYG